MTKASAGISLFLCSIFLSPGYSLNATEPATEFTEVKPYEGLLEDGGLYRASWPLSLKVKHGTAYHVDWGAERRNVHVQNGDVIVVRVKEIVRNQISDSRLNITYYCEMLMHFKPFNADTMVDLRNRLIAIATPEAVNRKLDLELFRSSVSEDLTIQDGRFAPHYIVTFVDKTTSQVGIGNHGSPLPALEVHISRNSLKTITAHYIK